MTLETPNDRAYLVEIENGRLRLSFNRPEQGNAMSPDVTPRLTEVFKEAQRSPEVRSILVRGEGKVFSAGGDVTYFAQTLTQSVAERQESFRHRLPNVRNLVEAVIAFEGPIVVAMRGAAAGVSLVFPLAADVVIGDPTALFFFAHQSIGLSPDGGTTVLLPHVVGHRSARNLLMTGARVKAEEALRLGLLTRLVSAEDLEAVSDDLAKRLALAPQRAIKLAKKLVNEACDRSLRDQLEAEIDGVVECVGDEDFGEGVRAFLDKRKPKFPSAR